MYYQSDHESLPLQHDVGSELMENNDVIRGIAAKPGDNGTVNCSRGSGGDNGELARALYSI